MKHWGDLSKAEKIERWKQAVRVLEGLSPHEKRRHFNMRVWGEKTDCGTVACAAGHCGLDTWFRRRGLSLDAGAFDGGPKFNAEEFFGREGFWRIFMNVSHRPVSKVVKEMREHIRELKVTE